MSSTPIVLPYNSIPYHQRWMYLIRFSYYQMGRLSSPSNCTIRELLPECFLWTGVNVETVRCKALTYYKSNAKIAPRIYTIGFTCIQNHNQKHCRSYVTYTGTLPIHTVYWLLGDRVNCKCIVLNGAAIGVVYVTKHVCNCI